MSFAEDVKNEIAHYETTDERVRRAELAALLCIGGTVLHGTADCTAGLGFSTSPSGSFRVATDFTGSAGSQRASRFETAQKELLCFAFIADS